MICNMAMLVIESPKVSCMLELFRQFDCMGIVIAEETLSIWIVKRQRIAYAVRHGLRNRYQSGFNFNLVSIFLLENHTIEVQQNIESRVAAHARAISSA